MYCDEALPWEYHRLNARHADQHHQGTDHATTEGEVCRGLILQQ